MSGPSPTVRRLKAAPAVLIPIAPAAARSTSQGERVTPTLSYRVATSLATVLDAWRLVHDCHRDQGFIEANAFGLHTTVQSASPGATVLCAETDGDVVSTLTIARDGARGLALDSVFGHELAQIRESGQRISEVGLMANRGAANALERLLSISLDCALRDDYSAVVMAVHPRHAGYFGRMFGFEPRSLLRETPNHGLAQLIHVNRDALLGMAEPPPGVRALHADPVPADFHAGAFSFLPKQVSGTVLAAYLAKLDSEGTRRAPRATFRA